MKSNYRRLGDYIELVDERNTGLKVNTLLGLSISKQFISSVANIIGTDMGNYKIIRKNQFACSTMQVRRDQKMPVALLKDYDKAIISQAYPVFRIKNESLLLPDYLMMWFRRSEFDREACFYAVGGVRGSLEWEDFCDMRLPVPSVDIQRGIVKEYNVIQDRIILNNNLIKRLEQTAQAIYNRWFVDFEFPDVKGMPYKSSGGEMIISEFGSMPSVWAQGKIFDLFELQRGFDLPTESRTHDIYPIFASTGICGKHSDYRVKAPCVITGRSGSLGDVFYVDEDFWPLNTTLWIKSFKKAKPLFSYYLLKGLNLKDYNNGSAVPTLNRNDIHRLPTIIPESKVIEKFELTQQPFFRQVKQLNCENEKLFALSELLLSRVSSLNKYCYELEY